MKEPQNLYRTLFTSTFMLSAFTFGGGYVIVPLMRKKFVEKLKWIDDEEMLNMISIAQSSPGALAVNTSVILGYKLKGIKGALVTVLGTILPPLLLLSLISLFYASFRDNALVSSVLSTMQAGVAAIILHVVYTMTRSILTSKNLTSALILFTSFLLVILFQVPILPVLILSALAGFLPDLSMIKEGESHDAVS
ncbi:chromate transporter [Proteiniclasticum ruminis]|uniref:Chromate transporter n=1 Tax=Proteiniclasticum ruminis TaxID=398199 RepID=A0A1I5AM40_9CLOT|nr:chromate transporter [Proteiniclasticum ruminis]SFN63554.1 chromate transporter [Proteiniclasticum ruminis]